MPSPGKKKGEKNKNYENSSGKGKQILEEPQDEGNSDVDAANEPDEAISQGEGLTSERDKYLRLRKDIHLQRRIRNFNREQIGLDPIQEAPIPSALPSNVEMERVLAKMQRMCNSICFEIEILWEEPHFLRDREQLVRAAGFVVFRQGANQGI